MALLRDVTAERELERKRREMQRLVSHELKTPLASIAGFGETLQRYELTPDEQHRVAELIRGESLRLGEMVATFLDLERLGSEHMTETTEPIDLGALVEQRLEILSQAARSRAQTIVSSIEDRDSPFEPRRRSLRESSTTSSAMPSSTRRMARKSKSPSCGTIHRRS